MSLLVTGPRGEGGDAGVGGLVSGGPLGEDFSSLNGRTIMPKQRQRLGRFSKSCVCVCQQFVSKNPSVLNLLVFGLLVPVLLVVLNHLFFDLGFILDGFGMVKHVVDKECGTFGDALCFRVVLEDPFNHFFRVVAVAAVLTDR